MRDAPFTEEQNDMLRKIFDGIDKSLTFFEEWTLFLTVMAALLSLFANVVLRYGFHMSQGWTEELVRLVVIYTTLIGCSAAVKSRAMIKIDALAQLAPILKRPLIYFSHLATLIFSTFILYYGWKMAALQVMTRQKTIIMQIPLVYLYALLPLMGAMMFIRTIMVLHQDISDHVAERRENRPAESPS